MTGTKRLPRQREPDGSKKHLDQLWARYRATRDAAAREQLILSYVSLVRRVVGRMGVQPLNGVDEEDLIGYGIIGLIEAIERFEPERGYRFETFAISRIRGSILDALRSLDPLPRLARQRVNQVRKAIESLQQRLGRIPTDEEVISYTGMGQAAYEQALIEAGFVILSLDAPLAIFKGEPPVALADLLKDPVEDELLEQIEEEELRQALKEALLRLPQREQLLLSLYYYEGLTMREIGEVLDLSQARVCQLHAKIILYLRASLCANGASYGKGRGRSYVRTAEPVS
ncbi:MAG: FliA/WhiG family RNA polymerase sigma factor [Anaerolineae bacterium]|nr:FliA/WhiG family RNA polymerase sigma factor [Anaerolineae bacterium]MDW8099686.1 FliA/WhiG family RNA polymerase sigma factor [Anaerolineae bacterium]